MPQKNQRRVTRPQTRKRFFNKQSTNNKGDRNKDPNIKIVIGRKRVWIFNDTGYDVVLRERSEFRIIRTYENRLGRVIVLTPIPRKEEENEYRYENADWV